MESVLYQNRISKIYGAWIAFGLVLYFLLDYYGGSAHVIGLRLLDLVIFSVGIFLAFRQVRKNHRGKLNYSRALTIGIVASVIGTSAFVVFLFVILNLDQNLFQLAVKQEPMGQYLNEYTASMAVWLECMFAGTIGTFILANFQDQG